MSTIYHAYANGKEITDFYIGGKSVNQVWGGHTLLWERNKGEEFKFTWSGNLAIMIWGDVKVSTGDGTTYNLKSDESSGTGRGLLLKKNDGKVYTATIRGNLKDIYFKNKIGSDGNTYRCDIIDVLTPFPKSMENVVAFDYHTTIGLFQDCLKLRSIPENLLINLPKLKSADRMFANSSLKSIPQGLFRENTEIESFNSTFYDTKIKSIPSGLFEHNKKVLSFAGCFGDCVQLSAIPSLLFAGLDKVETFSRCFEWIFYNFNGATAPIPQRTIPVDLFKGCTGAKNFNRCFTGNAGITSVPNNLFDDCPVEKIVECFKIGWHSTTDPMRYATLVSAPKLWEKFPNASGKGCFDGQRNLPWYYSIPKNWRGDDDKYYYPYNV